MRTLLQRLEINRAVAFLLLSRGWQFLSGFFTVILISSCLDEHTQGVYQVFISLVAMQMFVELGLPGIVSLLTSHEWAQLQFSDSGRIEGDPAALNRLSSLYRLIMLWFRGGAVLFLLGVAARGYFEIGREQLDNNWLSPWLALVAINAIALPYLPRLSILEGCHQVDTINYFRLWQAVTGTLIVWAVLAGGGGLWALAASSGVRWAWEFYLVHVRYRAAFQSLRESSEINIAACFREIWPLSWRVALQTMGAFFSSFYFVPVIFRFQGDIEAGRFGLTWGILMTMQNAALSWVNTRMPEFGAMASRNEHFRLRQRLTRTGLISLLVFAAGASVFVLVLLGLQQTGVPHATRFLDLKSTSVLMAGLGLLLITNILQISVRLYKRDPFLIPNLITSLAIAVLAWLAGQRYGSFEVGVAYAVVIGTFSLPVSFWLAAKHQSELPALQTCETA